jgi:hypothetical protein
MDGTDSYVKTHAGPPHVHETCKTLIMVHRLRRLYRMVTQITLGMMRQIRVNSRPFSHCPILRCSPQVCATRKIRVL